MHLDGDTTTFGDPTDFAIEAGVEPDLNPPSAVWGHMCVWCGGAALGDLQERSCGLYHAYTEFQWLAEHLEDLWDEKLLGLGDLATWNFLDGLLYGYHGDVKLEDGRTVHECRADGARYGKFDFLTNWGEQFDGFKSFLLCPPRKQHVRVLSRQLPALGVNVSKSAFLAASRDFVLWYEEQESRLRG